MYYLKSESKKVFHLRKDFIPVRNDPAGSEIKGKANEKNVERLINEFNHYLEHLTPIRKVYLITGEDHAGNRKCRIVKTENPRMELRSYKTGDKRMLDEIREGLLTGELRSVTFEVCSYPN